MGFLTAIVAFALPVLAKEEPANHTQMSDVYVVANASQTLNLPRGGEFKANPCSCVGLAKELTGFNKVVGLAKNWPINSDTPTVGGVVITNENQKFGHVAFITKINYNTIVVVEANYQPCRFSSRTMPINSDKIIGYYDTSNSELPNL